MRSSASQDDLSERDDVVSDLSDAEPNGFTSDVDCSSSELSPHNPRKSITAMAQALYAATLEDELQVALKRTESTEKQLSEATGAVVNRQAATALLEAELGHARESLARLEDENAALEAKLHCEHERRCAAETDAALCRAELKQLRAQLVSNPTAEALSRRLTREGSASVFASSTSQNKTHHAASPPTAFTAPQGPFERHEGVSAREAEEEGTLVGRARRDTPALTPAVPAPQLQPSPPRSIRAASAEVRPVLGSLSPTPYESDDAPGSRDRRATYDEILNGLPRAPIDAPFTQNHPTPPTVRVQFSREELLAAGIPVAPPRGCSELRRSCRRPRSELPT